MKDFKIIDNLIISKDSISAIFEIEPFDIALLSEQDRATFYQKICQAINVIAGQVQILAIKEKAKICDYSQHLNYVLSKAESKKERLIKKYTKELTKIVKNGNILILKYYLIFSVANDISNSVHVIEGINKLENKIERFTDVLFQAGIEVSQLVDDYLIKFVKKQLR